MHSPLDFDCPHLTSDAVDLLVAANVAVVGIDSLNIDDPTDAARPAHDRLLGADIPISLPQQATSLRKRSGGPCV